MDVGKYDLDGAWIEVAVKSEREVEPFCFKVQPLSPAQAISASKSGDEITAACAEAVIDWNLTMGDEPLPCTSENKNKYLARFATYLVKSVNGKEESGSVPLSLAILSFASRPDNFLKN